MGRAFSPWSELTLPTQAVARACARALAWAVMTRAVGPVAENRRTASSHADTEAPFDSVGLLAGDESPAYPIVSFSASCELCPFIRPWISKFPNSLLGDLDAGLEFWKFGGESAGRLKDGQDQSQDLRNDRFAGGAVGHGKPFFDGSVNGTAGGGGAHFRGRRGRPGRFSSPRARRGGWRRLWLNPAEPGTSKDQCVPEAARTPEQAAALTLSDELVGELKEADEYVFGIAMHNFSIPSVLKLWIDQIARVGKTLAYGE